jgi:hypothetical protein
MEVTVRKYDLSTGLCEGAVSSLDFGVCQSGRIGEAIAFDIAVSGIRSVSSVKLSFLSVDKDNSVPSSIGLCDDGLFAVAILDALNPAVSFTQYFCGIGSVLTIPMRSTSLTKYIHMAASPKASYVDSSLATFEVSVEYVGGDPSIVGSSSSASYSSSSSSYNPESSSHSHSSHVAEVQCSYCDSSLSEEYYVVFDGVTGVGGCGGCIDCIDLIGSHRMQRISPCMYFDDGSLGGNGILRLVGSRWVFGVYCGVSPCVEFTSPFIVDCGPDDLTYSMSVIPGGCVAHSIEIHTLPPP